LISNSVLKDAEAGAQPISRLGVLGSRRIVELALVKDDGDDSVKGRFGFSSQYKFSVSKSDHPSLEDKWTNRFFRLR
jgi:hypothetical protein